MAMTVLNNTAAQMTLGELNKNISRVGKDLRKISSGDRLDSYERGPSDRAISEKMRVKLRALEQCDRNTQTGKSMIKVASGGVDEQLEILKKMREIALKSSDDAYTDVDRDVLQKETKQLWQQVDDIAQETNYNNKPLLNGITMEKTTIVVHEPQKVTNMQVTGYSPKKTSTPSSVDLITSSTPTQQYSTTAFYTSSGDRFYTEQYIPDGTIIEAPARTGSLTRYNLDFVGLNGKNLPSALSGQGMSFLCSGCKQFVSIAFDTTLPIGAGSVESGNPGVNGEPIIYKVGVSDVRKPNDLGKALYEGIKNATPSNTNYDGSARVASAHNIKIKKEGDSYVLGEFSYAPSYSEVIVDMEIEKDAPLPYQDFRIQDETKASMYTNLRFPNTTSKVLFPPEDSPFALDPAEKDYPNPWTNDYLNLSDKDIEYYNEKYDLKGDMEKIRREKWRDEFWPYPRKGAMQSENCVRTKEGAKKFIADIDNAINYILDTSTTLGAYSMRMTISNENIVTKHENTTASESVIRDADMAKEMTAYAKDNVIMQSSQAMLSQANQNASGVLSLLQ